MLKVKFTDNLGKYVFHCHILEHEDDAMMAQFEVVP
ncbi:MAG: multicopper oxidase domain-containing protein [Aeromicrobium sp.]